LIKKRKIFLVLKTANGQNLPGDSLGSPEKVGQEWGRSRFQEKGVAEFNL